MSHVGALSMVLVTTKFGRNCSKHDRTRSKSQMSRCWKQETITAREDCRASSVYTGLRMCLPFGVYLHEIWYIDGWVSVTDPMHPICKIGKLGVFFGRFCTQFGLNWVFFCRKLYIEGSKNFAFFRYSE